MIIRWHTRITPAESTLDTLRRFVTDHQLLPPDTPIRAVTRRDGTLKRLTVIDHQEGES